MFDSQEYNHRVPRTDDCVEEDNQFWLAASNYMPPYPGYIIKFNALRNCGYDTVGVMLEHLLSNSLVDPVELKPKADDWRSAGIFKAFSQNYYLDDYPLFELSGLAPVGYMYYPYSCYEKDCRIHFYFHGCALTNNGWYNQMAQIESSGFLDYAASNDMIMVFPQVWDTLTNQGCFDGTGWVTDAYEYDTRDNVQVKFVNRVVEALSAERDGAWSIFDEIGNRGKFAWWWWLYDGPFSAWNIRYIMW